MIDLHIFLFWANIYVVLIYLARKYQRKFKKRAKSRLWDLAILALRAKILTD
jgi:hypothetical protein